MKIISNSLDFCVRTFPLGTYFGIPLRLTTAFLLWFGLLTAIFVLGEGIKGLLLLPIILAVFTIVILHEYGHCYAARCFGYKTHNIIIHPLGGLARIEGNWFKNPKHEFWIGIAGPLVNVVIAVALLPMCYFSEFAGWLAEVNMVILLFNLCNPVTPFDGSRILHAAITTYYKGDWCKAGAFCAKSSIVIALFVVPLMGFYWSWWAACIVAVMAITATPAEWSGMQMEKQKEEQANRLSQLRKESKDRIRKIAYEKNPDDPVAAEQEIQQVFAYWEWQDMVIDELAKRKEDEEHEIPLKEQFEAVMEYAKKMPETVRQQQNERWAAAETNGQRKQLVSVFVTRALYL